MNLINLGKTITNTLNQIKQAWFFTDDFLSFLRLSSDFILYRVLKVIHLKSYNNQRTINCASGSVLTYRLNRGDIQSIREVFLDESYRLPFSIQAGLLVDLGANLGLTSIWLSKHYGFDRIIAVEPDPDNARLVRKNFIDNGINGTVVEAAIGPRDGLVTFSSSQESNLGRIALDEDELNAEMRQIKMISMPTLLSDLPDLQKIDLVKMDIEGGEQQLLSDNLSWLSRVRAIIAEFHPEIIDYPGLTKVLEKQNFHYICANSLYPGNMDSFLSNSLATTNELLSLK